MLAPSSFEAGTRLRAKRERLHLSIRRVAQLSQKIAQEKNDPAFFVPHNWISDLENGKSKPRLLPRFHSLSLIYDCDINEILAAFGLNIADLGNERGYMSLPHTHLSGLPRAQSDPRVVEAPQLPLKLPLQQTNLVHRMFQGLGEMPFFLLQQAGPQEVLYGYVGTDDYTLDPIIRPGAFVQIDPEQNKVIRGLWPSEYERPVYFVELRDNRYAVCWCELEGNPTAGPFSEISGAHPASSISAGRRYRGACRGLRSPDRPFAFEDRCLAFGRFGYSPALRLSRWALRANGPRCVGSGYFEHLSLGFEKRHSAMIPGRESLLMNIGRRIQRLDIKYPEHLSEP